MGLPRYDKLPEPMPEEQRLREAPVAEDWDVIIVGGGFAGLYAALHFEKTLARDPDIEVTLVNRENFFLFTPIIPTPSNSTLSFAPILWLHPFW